MWSPLPLAEGDRVVAIQVWDREGGRRRDTTWQDLERWRASLQMVGDVGAFEASSATSSRPTGFGRAAAVAEISAAGFRVARVPASSSAGKIVRRRRRARRRPRRRHRPRRLAATLRRRARRPRTRTAPRQRRPYRRRRHARGLPVPRSTSRYWVPLRPGPDRVLRNTVPKALSSAGSRRAQRSRARTLRCRRSGSSRRSPVTRGAKRRGAPAEARSAKEGEWCLRFAFTGDFDPGELGLLWSMSSLLLVLLLLPPGANIAILNYARTVTRQQGVRRAPRSRRQPGADRRAAVHRVARADGRGCRGRAAGPARRVGRGGWSSAEHPRRPAVLDDVRRVVPLALRRRPGLGWCRRVRPRAGAPGNGAPGAAGCRRARGTDQRAARRYVDHAGHRASRLLGRRAAIGRRAPGEPCGLASSGPASRPRSLPLRASRWKGANPYSLAIASASWRHGCWPSQGILGVATALQPPRRGALGVCRHRGPRCVDRGRRRHPQWPAAGVPPVQPGQSRVLRYLSGTWPRRSPVPGERRRRGGRCSWRSSTATLPRPLLPVATRSGTASGTVRRDRQRVAARPGSGPLVRSRRSRRKPARDDRRAGRLPRDGRGSNPSCASATSPQWQSVRSRKTPPRRRRECRPHAARRRGPYVGRGLSRAPLRRQSWRHHHRCRHRQPSAALCRRPLRAHDVHRRAAPRREIGIRSALGAQPGHLVAAVFRRAFWQISAGAAAGMLAAYIAGRYVPIEQIGGLPIPGILPGAAAFMLLVGVLAALGPARRGLRIDPTEALRSE